MNEPALAQLDERQRAGIDAACNFINRRIATGRKRVLITAAVSGGIAIVIAVIAQVPVGALLGVALLPTLLMSAREHREVRRFYKQDVVPRIVKGLGSEFTYSAGSDLDSGQFEGFDLFNERPDVFRSEDQVCGKCKDIPFAVHEVRAAKEVKEGKDKREKVWFQGQVVKLDFNKNFQGHTVVIADRDSKRLGGLFGEAGSRAGKSLIHLADPDFENVYSVYSTNDQEANYLLTPKLMELMLAARSGLGSDIRFAFCQNSLFVTVPSSINRFEVGLLSNVTPHNATSDLAGVIGLTERLVDALDLETRIWTRV